MGKGSFTYSYVIGGEGMIEAEKEEEEAAMRKEGPRGGGLVSKKNTSSDRN